MRFTSLALLAAVGSAVAGPIESRGVAKARALYKRHFPDAQLAKRNNGGSGITDNDILNFALNLEYLEAQFYHIAAFGTQLSQDLLNGTGNRGYVSGNPGQKVPFNNTLIEQYAISIAYDEMHHVADIRAALGSNAVAMPELNLNSSFTAAAQAAGIIGANDTFSPYSSDAYFLLGAFLFEDTGVTAYNGAAPLIQNKDVLSAAAGILAAEAYHGGILRTSLLAAGMSAPAVISAANAAASLEAAVGNGKMRNLTENFDGQDNFGVPANLNKTTSIAYARTPGEVLNIVYLNAAGKSGLNYGGFFPNGLNGNIKDAAGFSSSS